MTTPRVIEIRRELEPTTPDTFIVTTAAKAIGEVLANVTRRPPDEPCPDARAAIVGGLALAPHEQVFCVV